MTTGIASPHTGRVARPLPVLVPLIQRQLHAADVASVEHYRAAGALLLEAKGQVPHGHWGPWVRKHFTLSARTAQDYMRLAESRSALRFSGLREAINAQRGARQARGGSGESTPRRRRRGARWRAI